MRWNMKLNNLTKNMILLPFNIMYLFSPKLTLKTLFRLKQGFPLNLEHPRTYTEKLQWIKLYDKNKLMPICCDKYTVRKYVKKKGCAEILNQLFWQGTDPEQIPFDTLPDQFVIKVTHGSTFNIICRDKSALDREDVKKKCTKWLKAQYLPCYGEWFYGIVKPRIIVEAYLEDQNSPYRDLIDYKIFCFNGKPEYIRVMSDRSNTLHEEIYDTKWNLLKGKSMGFPCAREASPAPECLEELLHYARILSEDFKHARMDFYIVNGKIYFGEITFTSGAGFHRFPSYEFDLEVGSKFSLHA